MKWWVYEDGEPSSRPYTKKELRSMVDIDPETRVRARNGTFRTPARDVPELQDLFSDPGSDPSRADSRKSFGDLLQRAKPPDPKKREPVSESRAAFTRFRREQKRFQFELLLTNPFLFFRRLDPEGSNLFALGFAGVVMLVGRFFALTYASLIPGYELPIQGVLQSINVGGESSFLILLLYFVVLLPLTISLVLLLSSAFFHGMLTLLGWNRSSYPATFKICCYTSASGLAQTIPLIGGGLTLVWGLVLFLSGMMEIHGLSVTRSIVLSLLPTGLVAGVLSLGIYL